MKTYSTSEFAAKAQVTVRAIRYYDEQGLLKPSGYDASGYRSYTDADFFKLQKIISLKYLGFSLKEISQLVQGDTSRDILELFDLQIRLMQKKIENMRQVEQALTHARELVAHKGNLEWDEVIHLIHLMEMENQLVEQYRNAENVSVRIKLHAQCSTNPENWYSWLLRQSRLEESKDILELGCGNGELWQRASVEELIGKKIVLSDISAGMVEDAKKSLAEKEGISFKYAQFDCENILYEDNVFDRVLANHVLFYCKNLGRALSEIGRVLKSGGMLCASTYGSRHMKEITDLVKGYDKRINLSEIELYEIFGLENGERLLKEYFTDVELVRYKDELMVTDADLLCDYIFSCHGNQNEILCDRKSDFRAYVAKKVAKNGAIRITKDAGVFLCRK